MHFYYIFVTIWSISLILLSVFEGTINYVCIFTRRGWGGAKAQQPAWIQVGHHMDFNLSLLEPFNVPLLGNDEFEKKASILKNASWDEKRFFKKVFILYSEVNIE